MQIKPFKLERYFAQHEFKAPYLLCCSDCESLGIDELLKMEPGAQEAFLKLRLGYTQSAGDPLLREQIAGLYHGIALGEILVHSGAEEAIFNAMNAVLGRDDHIIVHSPCYQSLAEVAQSIGCELTLWPAHEAKGWALDIDFLAQQLRPNTRMVVINCPHNPTGYLMLQDELEELVRLSQKHGFIIFSDEVYRFLEYDARDRLAAICDMDDRGVSLGVMSKTFGLAGLRIGWVATHNKAIYKRMAAYKDYTTICSSAPSEFLSTLALRNKAYLIERNLGIIKKNLSLLDAFFGRHSNLLAWHKPLAGPIAFPRLKRGAVERFCHDLLTRAGVLLLPGTLFGPSYSNFRIGFGRADLEKCIEQLENYLEPN